MRMISFIKIVLLCVFISSCGVGEKNPKSSDLDQKFSSVLERYSEENGIVGYSIAILKDGELVYSQAGGMANVELAVPVNTGQVFQLHSITKLFVITTLYQLVEEGKVDLDNPIATYLSDIPPHWQHITVRQILSHQSGLPEYFGPLRDLPLQSKGLLIPLFDKPMVYELGSQSRYNQTNYFLIGRIIETLTGQDVMAAIEDRMIKPFELMDTKFGGSDAFIPGRVSSYRFDQSGGLLGRNEFPFAPYQYASAGLNTSLSDLSKWFELLLEGDLISRETLYQSWQPLSYNDGREAAYANGWESRSDGDIRIVGHIGGGRMNARHYFNRTRPEASVTVLFFTNGAKYRYNLEDVSDELVSILSPELIGPAGGLRQKILQRVAAKDWPAIEVLYAAFRQNPATIDISIEGVINQLAYAASFQPETVDIAVKLFELNVRDYPESANVYDSMGDGYFAAGHYEKARENYQKAYEMDPERFTHIPQRLAEIKTKLEKLKVQ